jgi:hypothetical protein
VRDVALAPKWEQGHVQLVPKDGGQAREWPMEALLNRVIVIRDRLRVLERRITSHPQLPDAEKSELAAYVTRCFGSLTTFNVLFRDKSDQFVGQKGDD